MECRIYPYAPLDMYGNNPYINIKENNMTQATENIMSRMDVRLPLSVRETIDRAAAMQGRTRTDFLMEAALEKAEKVIAEQSLLQLAVQDQELLAKALMEEKVQEPTPFLASLSKEYATKVESK